MQGYEINGRMRALLVDWLIQVHSKFQLLQETLYLTVAILDRFLQVGSCVVTALVVLGQLAAYPFLCTCRFSPCHARSSSL